MKLRTNLLRVVLLVACLVFSVVVIVLLNQMSIQGNHNLGLFTILMLTLSSVVVVLSVPEMVKQKYNLK